MTEFTAKWIKQWRFLNTPIKDTFCISALIFSEALDEIERQAQRIVELEAELALHKTNRRLLNRDLGFAHERIAELEIQLKSKDIIINNQQGRLNYYATKDLFRGNNE